MAEFVEVKSIVTALLAWLFVIPFLLFLSPFFIYKIGVLLLAKILHPQLRPLAASDMVSSMDKIALGDDDVKFEYERRPLNNICVFAKLRETKTPLALKEIEQRFQQYIDKNTEFGWKLKSFLVRFCGYTFFQLVPKFHVSDHIRTVNLDPAESVYDYLNTWIMQQYSLKSALWEFLVLESDTECFFAFKMHHTIGDGISANQIMNDVLGCKEHPQLKKYVNSAPRRYSFSEMIYLILCSPALTLKYLNKAAQVTDPFKVKRGIQVEQYMSTSIMNLTDIKSTAKMQGASFNSVLLTIYCGAIQSLLRNKNQELPTEFGVPVALPWPGRPKNFIGNQYGVMSHFVPLNITDLHQLLHQIQEGTSRNYKSGQFTIFNHVVLNVMALFPIRIQTYLRNDSKEATTLSPMLAGDSKLYDGNVMASVYILTGITAPNFGLKALTLSFETELALAWTVVGSRSVFKSQEDLDVFTKQYIPAAFEKLRSAVSRSTPPIRNSEQVRSQE